MIIPIDISKVAYRVMTKNAAAYTAIFAQKVAQGMICGIQLGEKPLILEELLVGEEIEMRGESQKRPMARESLELSRSVANDREKKGLPLLRTSEIWRCQE